MRIILATLALAVVAIIGVGGAQSLVGPGLIRVTAVTEFERDLSGQRAQVSEIQDKRGDRIGWAVVLCTDLGGGGPLGSATAFCHGSYSFPKGRIEASGTRKARSSYVLAVVGGTGLYSNARGVLLVRSSYQGPKAELLLFSLEP